MATENRPENISITAGADLSSDQFKFVTLGGVLAGDGARGYCLQDKPDASGKATAIAIGGVTKCVAGAAVSVSDDIAADATGRGITAVATKEINGTALTAAAAAGEVFEMIAHQAGVV